MFFKNKASRFFLGGTETRTVSSELPALRSAHRIWPGFTLTSILSPAFAEAPVLRKASGGGASRRQAPGKRRYFLRKQIAFELDETLK